MIQKIFKNIQKYLRLSLEIIKNLIRQNKLIFLIIFSYIIWLVIVNKKSTLLIKYDYYLRLKSECECKNDSEIILYKYNRNDDYYLVNLTYIPFDKSIYLYNISNKEFENFNLTCDLYKVLRRGRSQSVIGYSLYGKNRFYYDKLINLTTQIKHFYPEWSMRVYYDNSINKSIICEIECQKDRSHDNILIDNSDFCFVENMDMNLGNLNLNITNKINRLNATYMHSMKWRWLPIGDRFVDKFMSRDSDSFILSREVGAVNEWLNSKKSAHLMRGISYFLKSFVFID
jgi:hypothetical protein